MDINNNYKRFQTYKSDNKANNFKQSYMEQNYQNKQNINNEKKELGTKKELSKVDDSFLRRSTRIGINSNGQFFKK